MRRVTIRLKYVFPSSMFLAVIGLLLLQLNSIRAGPIFDRSGGKISQGETSKQDETSLAASRSHLREEIPTNSIPTISLKTFQDSKDSTKSVLIGQPLFHGDSFMALPKLPSTARRSFELTITFKANAEDGLLLFGEGRTSEHKDFFALALRKRKVELRFSNGGDTAILQTGQNLTLGTWHKVVVFRDGRDGYLMLDNGLLVRGSTTHSQKQMDLITPLYLGGMPDTPISKEMNRSYSTGFNGCVKRLVVDGKRIDLRFPGGEVIRTHNIGECSNSLHQCNCRVKDSCQFSDTGEIVCACPLGTAGQHCEREVSLQLPSFTGNSYLIYPSLEDAASKAFKIRLVLKPKSDTGLIMLNADRTNGQGDFFSLSLREGTIEFLFDCGSGPAVIRSKNTVMVDHWHIITVWRNGAEGSLTLDDGKPVFGKSQGRLRYIRLSQHLFLGGMKGYEQQPNEVDMKWGFSGSIQKVTVNHVQLDLTSPLSGINVDNSDHVCATQPICLNGGTCRAEMDNFKCDCSVGYTGMFCEKELKIKMPSFVGSSYLAFTSLGKKSEKAFSISLVLKAKSVTGLILFSGPDDEKLADFVSLALRDGKVEYMFDCGSGPVLIRSQLSVTVDQWHTITISRNGNKGKLVLDDGFPVLGESTGPFSRITFHNHLFIGGVKDYAKQSSTIGMTTGFVGCIQKITLNSKPLVLSVPHSGINIDNCDHVCVTHNMCLNGGLCDASMESFRCQCAFGYTGKMCEEAVSINGYESDGQSFLTITRKRIFKRISGFNTIIRLEIKTSLRKGVIFFVHQPGIANGSWFLVCLNNGFLQVSIKKKHHQERFIKSRVHINDGLWHKVLIRRTLSTLFVQIDGGTPRKKPVDRFFLRFHPGEMLIGGLSSQVALKRSDWPTFQGSIRGLMIGGKRVVINNDISNEIKARRYRTSRIR